MLGASVGLVLFAVFLITSAGVVRFSDNSEVVNPESALALFLLHWSAAMAISAAIASRLKTAALIGGFAAAATYLAGALLFLRWMEGFGFI